MTWNMVVFRCSGVGRPFASIAGGFASGKPSRSYLPEGVSATIMKEPGFWTWSRLPLRLRLKLRCGEIQRVGRRMDSHRNCLDSIPRRSRTSLNQVGTKTGRLRVRRPRQGGKEREQLGR